MDWGGFATTAAGTVVWKVAYKPFDGVSTTTGTPPDARFPGQWFQTETGLYQNWMRNYDPATGRYIQADPLGLVDGASVYGYVRGNPEGAVDPRGEQGLLGGLPRPLFGGRITIPRPGFIPRPGAPTFIPNYNIDKTIPENDAPIDNPAAQREHDDYKDFCNNPPPETGSICVDLLLQAKHWLQCAQKVEDWDSHWKSWGRHKIKIEQIRNRAQNLLNSFDAICASRREGDRNYSPVPEGL